MRTEARSPEQPSFELELSCDLLRLNLGLAVVKINLMENHILAIKLECQVWGKLIKHCM